MTINWIIIVAAFVLLVLWEPWMRRLSQKPFHESDWTRHAYDRWRMTKDLMNSRHLHGMPREKVVDTLGPPERQSHLTFLYRTPSPFEKSDALRVCFDSSGRVFKVRTDHNGCP